jgi:exopolysaccharide biosynthesis polyprenyl glycosylphosphotransferase
MLHVLRHYLPLRKALLILSETALLCLCVGAVMTAHLLGTRTGLVNRALAFEGLTAHEALLDCLLSTLMVAGIAQLSLAFNELYDLRISAARSERFARFLGSSGLGIGLSVLAFGSARWWDLGQLLAFPGLTASQSIQSLVVGLLIGFTLLFFWRPLFHGLMAAWRLRERVLILGEGPLARALCNELEQSSGAGYELVGWLTPDALGAKDQNLESDDAFGGDVRFRSSVHLGATLRPRLSALPREALSTAGLRSVGAAARAHSSPALETAQAAAHETASQPTGSQPDPARGKASSGPLSAPIPLADGESLFSLAHRLQVDDLVVALANRRGTLPTDELLRCRLGGLNVEEGEALYERLTGKIAVEAMRPSYLIFNQGFRRHPLSEASKRAFDIVCALVGLFCLWPLMLVTALAVRLDSPGPILYRQERTGRFGRPVIVNKFRSMRTDAERSTGPVWAQKDDPRITRVGRIIRKTRLDELPQLFNVLGGSMSMVGPRPERQHFIDDLMKQIPYYDQRHIVKPGLTGWAQINYPYGSTVEDALQKLQFDLFYIKNRSLPFDLSIVIQTIRTVILRKGT